MRVKRVEKIRINLSTAYGLVLGQYTDYLRLLLKGQKRGEQTSTERDLLELIRSIQSLFHKYDEDMEFHHGAYHTLLRRFMLFRKGDYSNSEYKQRFKEQIEVLEAYNKRFLFGNSLGATAREIATLELDAAVKGDVEKAQASARGKYLATAFILSSDRRRYGELVLSLKNGYAKQQKNYPKTLTDMYGLMVVFDPTRATAVSGGRNEGMDFGNVAAKPGTKGNGEHGGFSATSKKIECWRCGGDHIKRDCPKRAKEREKNKKDEEEGENKRTEATGGQLHTMFTLSGEEQIGTGFSELGEDDKFTWHQFHVEGWGAQDFEEHTTVVMNNYTGQAVPLPWLLLDSQSTVELISNPRMLLNIRRVRSENATRIHCNSGVKVVDRIGKLPGYGTVWYKLTGIANILSMSRVTKKFRVIFDSEGRNFFRIVLPDREVKFQLSPNGLYYFDAADRENGVLLLKTVSENREGFTRRE